MTARATLPFSPMPMMWALWAWSASPAQALEAMADEALSAVSARDGITLDFGSSNAITADQIRWVTDDNGLNDGSCSGGVLGQHACTMMNGISIEGVGGPSHVSVDIDVGTDLASNAYLSVAASWSKQSVAFTGPTLQTASYDGSGNALGQFAIISEGSMLWRNRAGLFNSGGSYATFDLQSSGDAIYRQGGAGAAELSFADYFFNLGFTNGAAGGQLPAFGQIALDDSGIVLSSDFANVGIGFDLSFKGNAADFDVSGRERLIRFAWQGGLANVTQRIGAGGYGYGSYINGANSFQDYDGSQTGVRSQGLNLRSEWDFDSDFALLLGESGGNATYAKLKQWQRLGNAAGPMFSFPVIFDVVHNGNGPAGLCAGNFSSGVPSQSSCAAAGGDWLASDPPAAGEAAFAILLRDAHLLAYATQVEVTDPEVGAATPIDWGLAFTYGKLDADIFLRPEGRADGVAVATTSTGIRADITLLAQSPDAWRRANSSSAATRASSGDGWQTNTHFMLVDTNYEGTGAHHGVGIVNGDIMWTARDLFIRVTDGDSAYPNLPGGLWLQTDNRAAYRFRGIFGGGDLSDLSYGALTKVSLVDINLATSRFIFALNPLPVDGATGAAPIGFNGLLDFDGDAYFSFGEISSPQSTFYVNQLSGSVGWRDGSVALVSGANTGDGLPQLAIRNDIDIGASAGFGGAAGQPLVGTVGFGTEDFGRLAIPAGVWHSEVILKIPN